ncbi:MAG: hypothetical protein ABI554_02295 [Flavobacterium sp.]
MTSNVINQSPFLRTTRAFPKDLDQLAIEVNKAYLDIANTVNNRSISIYPTNRPALNGKGFFLVGNKKQDGFQQVYTFTATTDINLGFKLSSISEPTNMYGQYLSGTSWFGLIPATSVAIIGQISFYLLVNGASTSSDVIRFVVDGAAPALTRGKIVVEWISEP